MRKFKELGGRIRGLRGNTRQKDWADLLGVAQSYVSQIEAGVTKPSLELLIKIQEISGSSVDWILSGEGPKRQSKGSARRLTDKRRAEFAASHWSDMDKVAKSDRDAIMAMNIDMQADPKLRTTLVEHYQFLSRRKKKKRK